MGGILRPTSSTRSPSSPRPRTWPASRSRRPGRSAASTRAWSSSAGYATTRRRRSPSVTHALIASFEDQRAGGKPCRPAASRRSGRTIALHGFAKTVAGGYHLYRASATRGWRSRRRATIALKTLAWRLTDSVGLLSDALESLLTWPPRRGAVDAATRGDATRQDHPHGFSRQVFLGLEGALIVLAAAASSPAPCRA